MSRNTSGFGWWKPAGTSLGAGAGSRRVKGCPLRPGRQPPSRRRVRLCLEGLEVRLTLSTTIPVGTTTADLIAAIDTADHTAGPVVLVLPQNTTYTLTAPDDSDAHNEDNNWYGPNGLPAIDNTITVQGNGSTIERSTAGGTPPFRLFYVSGGMAGELPLGTLTLENLTLAGGLAQGGDGYEGGGGMGAGGAIFNQGTLILSGATLSAAITGSANLVESNDLTNTPIAAGVITVTGDPQLGPLQNNGGPTQTIALTSTSPAYGKGNANIKGYVVPSTDQHSLPRVVKGRLDLGAFELQPSKTPHASSSFPIVDNSGQVPFQIQLTPLTVPDAPALQSAASAEYGGKWLFIGGRTDGLHGMVPLVNNFPPKYQNKNIIVIDPTTGQVWTRPWSDSLLSQAVIDPLTSVATESVQEGTHLYVIGGYGVNSATGYYTTFDTLTSINVPGMIQAVIKGGSIAAQIQQIHNPVFQVTGGQLGKLGSRYYLVMGQEYLGDYFSVSAVQKYTDQIQSFQIIDTPTSLSIRNYQTVTDAANFHRRDFRMSPVILPSGQSALEAYGGVFTPTFIPGVWRQPITITSSGKISISPYQQFFSQYDCPQIPLYSATTHTMQTIFLGGISYYYYDPATTPSINYSAGIPFISTITDLVQPPSGTDQEYILPTTLPYLLGAEAAWMSSTSAPSYKNGVINLDAIHRPTTVGYMYGGIVADAGNFGNTAAWNGIYQVTLTPIQKAR